MISHSTTRAVVAQQATGIAIRASFLGSLATALTLGGARLLLSFAFGGRELALDLGLFASARDACTAVTFVGSPARARRLPRDLHAV